MFVPHIIEKTGRSEKLLDLQSRLLKDRIIYLSGTITDELANVIIMQLLWLNADDPDEHINLYINSPGGSVYSGLAIKDIMYNIKNPVNTLGVGICASMGSYLLASGTGTRKATENCRIMIHSVSSGTSGTVHDIEIDYKETKSLHNKLLLDMSKFSKGKTSYEEFKNLTERDFYMDTEIAISLGLVDSKI